MEERQALTQQLHQAAAPLGSVPSLVCGDPSKTGALQCSLSLYPWPADEQVAVWFMGALMPLAPRLGCLALELTAPLPVPVVSERDVCLGIAHTHIVPDVW